MRFLSEAPLNILVQDGRAAEPGPGSQGKERPADFETVGSKVGKKLEPATNVTNTSFKSRAIHMTQQTQAAAGSPTAGAPVYRGTMHAFSQIIRSEGYAALYSVGADAQAGC